MCLSTVCSPHSVIVEARFAQVHNVIAVLCQLEAVASNCFSFKGGQKTNVCIQPLSTCLHNYPWRWMKKPCYYSYYDSYFKVSDTGAGE